MRVKVSYTIDLEKVPGKVKDLVNSNKEAISEIQELSSQIQQGDLGVKSLDNLRRMRQLSEEMSDRFSDCESILAGFLTTVLAPLKGEVKEDDDNS